MPTSHDRLNRAAASNWRQLGRKADPEAGPIVAAARHANEAADAARVAAHRAGCPEAAVLIAVAIEELWAGLERRLTADKRAGRRS